MYICNLSHDAPALQTAKEKYLSIYIYIFFIPVPQQRKNRSLKYDINRFKIFSVSLGLAILLIQTQLLLNLLKKTAVWMWHMPGSKAEAQQWNIVCEVFVWETDGLCESIPNISANCADLWTWACVWAEGVCSHFHWHTPHYSDRRMNRPGWHGSADNAIFMFGEALNMSLQVLEKSLC